jgi:hypothetical protein
MHGFYARPRVNSRKTEYNTRLFAGTLVETVPVVMPARVEGFPFPHRPVRRMLKPILGWALVATVVAVIRRYTREPSLPRMSDQWLRSHQADFHRDGH